MARKTMTKTLAGVAIDDISSELFIAHYCTKYWEGRLSAATINRLEAIPGWDWNFDQFSTSITVLRRLTRELGDVIQKRWTQNEPA